MVNIALLIGNLTADPQSKTIGEQGTKVTEFSLALNSKRGDVERVDYFDIVTFGRLAETCEQYLAKGKKVHVEGRLEQQRWEKDGVKHQRVKVIANRVTFLTPNGGNAPAESGVQAEASGAEADDIPF